MKKMLIMAAVLAGFVAAGHAAFQAVSIAGDTAYDEGVYEVFTGDTSFGNYDQLIDEPEGQTITTSNAFDLGAISIVYEADVAVVSNVTIYVSKVDDAHASSYVVNPQPTGILFSATFDVPLSSGADDTLYLLLGTNISLAADSSYMIMFDMTSASSYDFWWRRSGSTAADFYPGGQQVRSGSGISNRDYLLGLGVTPPVTANDDEYILPAGLNATNVAAPGVLANDLRGDSAVLVADISSGSLTLNADGSFDVSGLSNGSNTFTYAAINGSETSTPATVLFFVTLTEDPPGVVDDTYVLDLAFRGTNIVGDVLNNDTNNSALYPLSAMLVDTVSNGTLSFTNNGDFVYVPNGGFSGTDSFTYKAYTPLEISVLATVTLNVEINEIPGVLIDSFEIYDNEADNDIRDMPDASANWDTEGSGVPEVDNVPNSYGPSYQRMQIDYNNGYRGLRSKDPLFSGIPNSSSEYWLYWEMYPAVDTEVADFGFGVTTNSAPDTRDITEISAGVRMTGTGSNLTLYAYTVGSNDVLLASGLDQDTWYAFWLDIDNAANTYDVYMAVSNGYAVGNGDASILGTQIGTNIAFDVGASDLTRLLAVAYRDVRFDNIINVDPDSFFINLPANLYGNNPAAFDTMQLSIGLNDRANAAAYWPVSSDELGVPSWEPVAHSDAPDGAFAVTNLNLASGDETNKVIYVKTTNSVEFFRINNQ